MTEETTPYTALDPTQNLLTLQVVGGQGVCVSIPIGIADCDDSKAQARLQGMRNFANECRMGTSLHAISAQIKDRLSRVVSESGRDEVVLSVFPARSNGCTRQLCIFMVFCFVIMFVASFTANALSRVLPC